MMSDNHYSPLPLHDFQVGEDVIFEFVDGTFSSGEVVRLIGSRMIVIQDHERTNSIVGGRLNVTVPFDHAWRLP